MYLSNHNAKVEELTEILPEKKLWRAVLGRRVKDGIDNTVNGYIKDHLYSIKRLGRPKRDYNLYNYEDNQEICDTIDLDINDLYKFYDRLLELAKRRSKEYKFIATKFGWVWNKFLNLKILSNQGINQ